MTYTEMREYVKSLIREGKPLHGLARDIAVEMALEQMEREANA